MSFIAPPGFAVSRKGGLLPAMTRVSVFCPARAAQISLWAARGVGPWKKAMPGGVVPPQPD
jgi:hypothetical protein